MPETSELIVLMLGVFVGSGLVMKNAGPYIFFYIVVPALSALAVVFLLEQLPDIGFDFQYRRYLDLVLHRQGDLAKLLGMGLAAGFSLSWISRHLFLDKYRVRRGPRFLVDTEVSMERKKHLRALGLNNSAGPRDILMAWTTLSAELRDPNWIHQAKNRTSGITPEAYKDTIDTAYAWLKANSEEASQDRGKRPQHASKPPLWKRLITRISQKKVRIRRL
ncbi:MAG: hypothetical protein AAFY34_05005 [Pseudomonadota bacterium]